ncbi:peptidoglycan-binding protein [Streptomyces jumonjinensis]|uniref:peptidoglycan-binding protein n=1 Tax=Streptomyces jumonjinensis TaxID=1945 RepID=UPI00378E0D9E
MSSPLSPNTFLNALLAEGLTVVEVAGWRTRNRNHKGPWGPVHGVMIHHTVTTDTDRSVALCRDGHAALPGPLCHGVIAKDGTVHLVGHGRANHAGLGDGDVLQAVAAERSLPADNEADTDGNRSFYGFECVNLGDGEDPWPAVQLEAIARVSAALCRAHGWSARSVIGHMEWQPGKIDPRGFTMDFLRDRIARRLAAGPTKPPSKPKPSYEPFPGAAFFAPGRRSAVITAMGKRLVAEGCGRYAVGPGPSWGEADRKSYAAWQRKLGHSGSDADGIPGPGSWAKLRVPNT